MWSAREPEHAFKLPIEAWLPKGRQAWGSTVATLSLSVGADAANRRDTRRPLPVLAATPVPGADHPSATRTPTGNGWKR
jgi:hypothetical protein